MYFVELPRYKASAQLELTAGQPPASPGASRDDEETKEGDIESLVAAEERGRKQARDDDVQEGWNRFVAEQSGELG